MEADHEKGAIGHFAGEFDHAPASREQIYRRRCRAAVAETDGRGTEPYLFSGKQPSDIADRVTHEGHARAGLPDTPR
jgi:hypothetical protein